MDRPYYPLQGQPATILILPSGEIRFYAVFLCVNDVHTVFYAPKHADLPWEWAQIREAINKEYLALSLAPGLLAAPEATTFHLKWSGPGFAWDIILGQHNIDAAMNMLCRYPTHGYLVARVQHQLAAIPLQ